MTGITITSFVLITAYEPPKDGQSCDCPTFVRIDPRDQLVGNGGTTTLKANVMPATGQYSFQWYLGNKKIPGATNAVLRLSDIHADQGGRYMVMATGKDGSYAVDFSWLSVAPELDLIKVNGRVRSIRIVGEPGYIYTIEYALNLDSKSWKCLPGFKGIVLKESAQIIPLEESYNWPTGFYRLREEKP